MTNPNSASFDPTLLHELDVRDILGRGEEPLALILRTADAIAEGHVLHLRSPFQPVPLYQVLGSRGFEHHSVMFESDDWSTWFWRHDAPPADRPEPAAGRLPPIDADVLDLRMLPAPEPLLRILEATDRSDAPFRVALPAFPAPLIAILDGCGWGLTTETELEDGSFVVRIAPTGT